MPIFAYRTVDVFSERRFGGNPLAVLPDARGLGDEDMQRIAAEFGYSETTFVLPPSDPANSARVRIFTPISELPFAGHPNVGTGYLLGKERTLFDRPVGDTLRFEEGAGLVEVRLERDAGALVGAEIRAPAPLSVGAPLDVDPIAACASLPVSAVVTSHHPPVMVSVGLPFAVAEVTDVATLGRAAPDSAAFAEAAAEITPAGFRFSLYLYARLHERPERVQARMFAPLEGVAEDPATGSAAAALGGYLFSLRPEPELRGDLAIAQGVEMGRPSEIRVRVVRRGGAVESVAVAGRVVEVMRGVLEL